MPIPSFSYSPLPFYQPRVTPDNSRLQQIYANSGAQLANLSLQRGATTADTLNRLASIISAGSQGVREDRTRKEALAVRKSEQEAAKAEREAERAQAKAERDAQEADRKIERETVQKRLEAGDAYKRGTDIAERGSGPLAENQVDDAMAGPAAGLVRYSFGPGTAEGPELTPSPQEVKRNALTAQLERMGYTIGPNGQAIKNIQDAPNETQTSLAVKAAKGDPDAIKALEVLRRQRPVSATGGSGNQVEMSPETIDTAAHRVMLKGPSSIPTRFNENDKKRILNRESEINKSIGRTPAAAAMRAAVQTADQGALNKITNQAASAEAFENKALQQSDLVKELSAKVGRTDYPVINGALVSGKAAMGDTPAHLLGNALLTYTSEYAKIMEGSTGSAAGSSDAARRSAAELISKALSKGTLAATVDQMNREMGMTRAGYRTTIDDITERMGGGASATTPPAHSGRFIEAIDENGGIHHAPAGTPLPAGWKLKQ